MLTKADGNVCRAASASARGTETAEATALPQDPHSGGGVLVAATGPAQFPGQPTQSLPKTFLGVVGVEAGGHSSADRRIRRCTRSTRYRLGLWVLVLVSSWVPHTILLLRTHLVNLDCRQCRGSCPPDPDTRHDVVDPGQVHEPGPPDGFGRVPTRTTKVRDLEAKVDRPPHWFPHAA